MAGPPFVQADGVTIYYTEDPQLSRVVIFYWPVTTAGSSVSSRHRVTILTKIGHASFPPFQVSPQSSYYGAVAQLTDERQREEIYRVIVFSLAKYFDTLPAASKENGYVSKNHTLYDDRHAGAITNKLCKVTNPLRVVEDVQSFYASTSKLQETTPRPTSSSRSTTFSSEQKQAVRLAMCEVVDTEERYVSKMHELLSNTISEFRERFCTQPATSNEPPDEAVSKLFPASLDSIFTVNRGFLDSVRNVLEITEDTALEYIAASDDVAAKPPCPDPLGIRAFAKVLTTWFPKFLYPYREYLYAHTTLPGILTSLLRSHASSSFSRRVRETGGEQKLRSMLMEPVQRLPRYSLLIDSMTQPLPAVGEEMSLKLLAKARDVIAEICAMETPVSKVLEALTISYEEEIERKEGSYIRSLSPVKLLSSWTASGDDRHHHHHHLHNHQAQPHQNLLTKNVPRLVAPEDGRDGDKERGRERSTVSTATGGGTGFGSLRGYGGGGSISGGSGGSLRRAWSRRVSPVKRDHSQKENLVPSKSMPTNNTSVLPPPPLQKSYSHSHSRSGSHFQPQLQSQAELQSRPPSSPPLQLDSPKLLPSSASPNAVTAEMDRLRRENAALREMLDRCTCGAGG